MPVFSSGQSARQAAGTLAALGSTDLIFAAGGGIMAHPGGPAEGVRALREAFEAAMAGVPADHYASTHPALAAASAEWRPHERAPPALPDGLLFAFYGDDFTGSSAVMEVMTFAGLPAVMFVETPTPEQLRTLPQLPSDRHRGRRPSATTELDGRAFAFRLSCPRSA